MNMKIPKTVLLLILSLVQYVSTAQDSGILSHAQASATIEKVYLHTDRDFYFLGDTIWFKAYLLDGQSLSPVSDNQNLYIDLSDSTGSIACNQVLLCENGNVAGNIVISDTTATGPFVLRAYTDYLKNFGEEMFFHKTLRISEVKNFFELELEKSVIKKEKQEIDVSFFPEGGYLLEGTQNIIAFKAVDKTGKGVSMRGVVLDNSGQAVSIFKTDYKGMGKLFFIPQKGKSYEVRIDGYPDFEYRFKDIRNETEKLVLLKQSKEELKLGIISNSGRRSREHFYIACFSRDSLLFYKEIVLRSTKTVRVETDVMLGGINRFVLLNESLEPVSERLVFHDDLNVNNLEIKTTRKEVATRSPVQLEIFDDISSQYSEYSSLSITVVDENALIAGGAHQHMISYLFLDSELKGFIESPADYFVDDEDITSRDKLNLLMLTNGWNRYLRSASDLNSDELEYSKTAGITIKGNAERIAGKKPIVDGAISIGLFTDSENIFLEGLTDSTGWFSTDSLIFFDTATIFVQALNERGKKRSEVYIDTKTEKEPTVSPHILKAMQHISDIPLQYYRQKYYSDVEYREYNPDDGSILLEEVEIKSRKVRPDDGHIRIYHRADQVIEVTDSDRASGSEVLQFLQGRVAGLIIGSDYISLRGFTSIDRDPTPLILVDGVPIYFVIEPGIPIGWNLNTPMQDIDKVEILKGTSAAIFGSRGANGVIAIYTRKGEAPEIQKAELVGAITQSVVGFSSNREFYSPKYTPENIDFQEPDHRTTLHWEPDLITEDGKASLSFLTADDLGYYRIIVEGVTENGRICLGSARFAVDKHHR